MLAYLILASVVIMVLGIENALQNRMAFLIFFVFLVVPVAATRKLAVIGLTAKNLAPSILSGGVTGLAYGAMRGLALRTLPFGKLIFGADLALIAARLESGIKIGTTLISKDDASVLLLLFMFPFMILMEMYFRGLLFRTVRRYVHWAGAVAIASAVQAVARRTPHSLIMGSIGGVLMQKYDNILAPSLMHIVQFFTALAIFLYG